MTLISCLVALSKQDCPGTPTVLAQQVFQNSAKFQAKYALAPSCGETALWKGPHKEASVGFTVEYDKEYIADGFHVRNDPNRQYRDR